MQNDFGKVLKDKFKQYGIAGFSSIEEMKVEYESLVEIITDGGYAYTLFELDDDLSVRKKIDLLLLDEELIRFDNMINFQKEITQIDHTLQSFFLPGFVRPQSKDWWEKGVLREAGPSYAENVKTVYGLDVKISR